MRRSVITVYSEAPARVPENASEPRGRYGSATSWSAAPKQLRRATRMLLALVVTALLVPSGAAALPMCNNVATSPPTPSFTVNPASGTIGTSFSFDGSSSTGGVGTYFPGACIRQPLPINSYQWDFGDGTAGSGRTISHSYTTSGTYTVTLTVDSGGGTYPYPDVSNSATMTVTVGIPVGAAEPTVSANAPGVPSSTSAALSGSVNPRNLQTTAVFQYGLDPSYNGGGPVVYTNQVAASPSPVGSDSTSHPVSATATGLDPNALYHVRLVASNGAGTTFGPDQTFRTAKQPPPPPPVQGTSVNVTPVSGNVYIKVSGSTSGGTVSSSGPGYLPLTDVRSIPAGAQVDSRFGKFVVQSASGQKGKFFSGTFGGAVVAVSHANRGAEKGLTTFKLLLGAFAGAPSLKGCSTTASRAAASRGPLAQAASLSSVYHSSSHGRYRVRYGRASGSSSGTQWDTIVSCAGVRFTVFHGTVLVNDSGRHRTVSVRAGHSYLAER